jgi:hypothetical protein
LIVDDGVAAETDLIAVKVDAAGQQQTGDSDGGETAARDGEAVGFQPGVDVAPADLLVSLAKGLYIG